MPNPGNDASLACKAMSVQRLVFLAALGTPVYLEDISAKKTFLRVKNLL